jgi:hypothetical protein
VLASAGFMAVWLQRCATVILRPTDADRADVPPDDVVSPAPER